MENASRFRVGGWTITPRLNLLEHADGSVTIETRPMDVLVCLANRAPETVSVDDLIREVWRGRIVTDNSIYLVINQLRNAFGESTPNIIQTIRKRGYRLTLPVEFLPEHVFLRDQLKDQRILPERRSLAAALAFVVVLIVAAALYLSPWSSLQLDSRLDAQTIASSETLEPASADSDRITAALQPSGNDDASDYYLLARQRMQNPTGLARDWPIADADLSIDYFRRTIELDPAFARAHAGLAEALLRRTLIVGGFADSAEVPQEVHSEAMTSIEIALELDPNLAEAHVSRGIAARVLEGDNESALESYRLAVALDPMRAETYYGLGKLLHSMDDDEAIAAFEAASRLDPLSSEKHRWLGRALSKFGSDEEALRHFRLAELTAESPSHGFMQAATDEHYAGRPDEGIRLLTPLLGEPRFAADEPKIRELMATLYLDLNNYQTAEELLSNQRSPASLNTQIHVALAQGQDEQVIALVQTWKSEFDVGYETLVALYETVIGHYDHARELFGAPDADFEPAALCDRTRNFRWGYYPGVTYANLLLKVGDENAAAALLDTCREILELRGNSEGEAGGVGYLLASIAAIEGDGELALIKLRDAMEQGWTRHWYAPRDPNLENLWDEPRFQTLIGDLKAKMDSLRLAI